ncbi:hypothetical protein PVK06_021205 [Gossypium arboreum]|uniref:Uncharacterized protein n=1 Tax=Gossypium arboreum TaxID=29729 RepID=A0ABR0PPK1_GOSAR|nr:hypothetical protein PVK06_021205 [Gossypium arboreum]
MKDFQALVREIEILGHAYFGPVFTWPNNQLNRPIVKKLDRVLVNATWLQFLPHSRVEFAALGGDPMLKFFTKLKRLKLVLKMLNTKAFGNIFARVKAKVEELESLQLALLRDDLVRNGHTD